MKYSLSELKNRQIINALFTVHPQNVAEIQRVADASVGDEYIETTIPNYWAAALQGISVSSEAKKHRMPKIRFF